MAAPITAADLSNFEPKFISRARFTLQHKTLARGLFHTEPLPKGQGRTLNVPKYGEFEAYDAIEGVEVDNPQILTQSNFQVTPTEIVAQFLLTDVAVRTGGENHVRNGGKALGEAMAKKLDLKGLARFANLSTHQLGSAGTAITVGHVTAAVSRLRGGTEPAPKPYHMVLRPETMSVLLDQMAPPAAGQTLNSGVPNGITEEIIQEYLDHDFALFNLKGGFSTSNLTRDASDDAVGAVFSKEAIWYVPADEMDIEKARNTKARAWLFQASHTFGFGEYNEAWGVRMTFDAANQSS